MSVVCIEFKNGVSEPGVRSPSTKIHKFIRQFYEAVSTAGVMKHRVKYGIKLQ
jgi:hypothetical protein